MAVPQPLFTVDVAKVGRGSLKQGYGLEFELQGPTYNLSISNDAKLFVTFAGDFWKGLPAGAASLAGWILPLRAQPTLLDVKPENSRSTIKFILGAKRLSSQTLMNGLDKQVSLGDPPLLVEILRKDISTNFEEVLVCDAVFRCSAIAAALRVSSKSNVLNVADSRIRGSFKRQRSTAWGQVVTFARWWFLPTCFAALCWQLAAGPEYITDRIMSFNSSIIGRFWDATDYTSVTEQLPPFPALRSSAFTLGVLKEQLLNANTSDIAASIMKQAGAIVGRTSLSLAQLEAMKSELLLIEQHQSTITRVMGMFSFINIIWFSSIVGIGVSIGPSIYYALKPLERYFRRMCKWAYERIIRPTAIRLHEWGVFELCAWGVCASCVVDGVRIGADAGFFVAATGAALAGPSLSYSALLHGGQFLKSMKGERVTQLYNGYAATVLAPLAIFHQASFFGFLSVCAFYGVLGFSTACYGLCYVIGFHSKEAMARVACTSFMTLSLFTALKLVTPEQALFYPFESGVAIMGSVTLYLAFLIMSTKDFRSERGYVYRQSLMIGSLIMGHLIGYVYLPASGIAPTSNVFLVLYMLEKGIDLHGVLKWNIWILILGLSLVSYRSALWLHNHPEFVVQIFRV